MNTKQMLDTLNTLRVNNGKAPLKAWKDSKAKLEALINTEANAKPKKDADFEASVAELQRQQPRIKVQEKYDIVPHEHTVPSPERTAELKQARLENDRKNKKLEEMEKDQPSPSLKKEKIKRVPPTKKAGFSMAQIILDFGLDPKQGRALLRKHKVAKTPEAVRKFFKDRQK